MENTRRSQFLVHDFCQTCWAKICLSHKEQSQALGQHYNMIKYILLWDSIIRHILFSWDFLVLIYSHDLFTVVSLSSSHYANLLIIISLKIKKYNWCQLAILLFATVPKFIWINMHVLKFNFWFRNPSHTNETQNWGSWFTFSSLLLE